jgi:hypothetical protein
MRSEDGVGKGIREVNKPYKQVAEVTDCWNANCYKVHSKILIFRVILTF